MDSSVKAVYEAFEGKLVGKPEFKVKVCEAVLLLPQDVQRYVTKNCWFLSSFADAYGYTFAADDIPHQFLVILTDELFDQEKTQIFYTILHEIGHIILKHRNAVRGPQSQREIDYQEREADEFAKKYLVL